MPQAAIPIIAAGITTAAAGTAAGLQAERGARAQDAARRARRATRAAITPQQEREREALAGLKGEFVSLEDPFARLVRQREALQQVETQFAPAQQQITSQFLARGLPGQAQQAAGQAELAQAAAEAQSFRGIFLQEEQARRNLAVQIAQITGQVPPSLQLQQGLAGQELQSQQLQQQQFQNVLGTLLGFLSKSGAGFQFPGAGGGQGGQQGAGQFPTVTPEVQVGSPNLPGPLGVGAFTNIQPRVSRTALQPSPL